MMSIRSLADFNRSSLGGDGDWLTPPPSPPRPCKPGRHDERGMGTFNWPPARTSTWPYTGTFSWPRTVLLLFTLWGLRGQGVAPPMRWDQRLDRPRCRRLISLCRVAAGLAFTVRVG